VLEGTEPNPIPLVISKAAGARPLIKESGYGNILKSQLEVVQKLSLDARSVRSDLDLLCSIWINHASVLGIHVRFSAFLKIMVTDVKLQPGEYCEVLFLITKYITQTPRNAKSYSGSDKTLRPL
jgi:hypothetical protein